MGYLRLLDSALAAMHSKAPRAPKNLEKNLNKINDYFCVPGAEGSLVIGESLFLLLMMNDDLRLLLVMVDDRRRLLLHIHGLLRLLNNDLGLWLLVDDRWCWLLLHHDSGLRRGVDHLRRR